MSERDLSFQFTNGEPDKRLDLLELRLQQVFDRIGQTFSEGGNWTIVRASSAYVAKPWESVLCNPTAAAFPIVLPDPVPNRQTWIAVKNDSASTNAITIRCAGSTIDGSATKVINTARASLLLMSNGDEWKVMSQ